MGESETIVTGTSTVMDYTSSGYTSVVSGDASSNAADGNVATSAVAADAAGTLPTGPTIADGNTYGTDPYAVIQGAHVDTAYESDTKPVAGLSSIGKSVLSDNATAVPSQATDYNSVNGNFGGGAGIVASLENGNVVNVVDGAAAEQRFVDGSAMSSEEENLWTAVKANSLDFDSWTRLIEETEKVAGVQDKILKIRKVYDAFLAEFPLCYGYWKKYADHEMHLGFMDKVVEVYERAVLGVTYSVDIWLHYFIFATETYADPDTIRRLFERGLDYVGTDYLSYPIWDKYLEYEEMHAEWGRVATLYTRILEIPNKRLDDYFVRFKAFAASRPFSELRTAEEAVAAVAALSEAANQGNEGEIHPDATEQSSKSVSAAGLTEAEELEKFVAIRKEMYKKAKEFDSKVSDFENAITRPYFHMKPLPITELENWHNYLDFIETEDDLNKVVKLYERCLIACANYPEYWVRYVLCMETCGSMDLANNALARATQVFVKRQPEIHLFAARFREQNGDIPGARASYQRVHAEIAPGLVEAIIKHANMEHRLGNLEDAFSLYEQAIAIEKGKEHSQTLPMLYAQYSRFLYLVSGNASRAREILVEGLENVQLSKPLLEALIHLETIQSLPRQIEYLDSLVDKFIRPNLDTIITASAADREELSCIYMEFLGMFGDAQCIKKAEDRHAKLFIPHRSKSELKKRHAEDCLASDKAKLPKSYSDDPSPAHSLMSAYPNAQNPWAAGYGVQPQALPPVTPVQVQQWTPSYGQQAAAYGAYGVYGSSYTSPQVPTTVAQAAAYSAYPSTYPVQAFPQHSYSQPNAMATLVPAQQPASVTQPYYGSYY